MSVFLHRLSISSTEAEQVPEMEKESSPDNKEQPTITETAEKDTESPVKSPQKVDAEPQISEEKPKSPSKSPERKEKVDTSRSSPPKYV